MSNIDHDGYTDYVPASALEESMRRHMSKIWAYAATDPDGNLVAVARTLEIAQECTRDLAEPMGYPRDIVWTDELRHDDGDPLALWHGTADAGRLRWRIVAIPLSGFHGYLATS